MTSNALIGIAGVHYVVAELSRRGVIALPTIRNTAAYDIVVATPAGTKHANIQVKTSLKRKQFFPMPPPEKIRAGPRDFYVLVRWLKEERCFEGFMLSGRHARAAVEARIKIQKGRIRSGHRKAIFPTIRVDLADPKGAPKWRRAWDEWKL